MIESDLEERTADLLRNDNGGAVDLYWRDQFESGLAQGYPERKFSLFFPGPSRKNRHIDDSR
jgi:hypothetical protein